MDLLTDFSREADVTREVNGDRARAQDGHMISVDSTNAVQFALGSLSQAEMAKALDLSRATICLWVGGKRTPSILNLGRMCAVSGVPLQEAIDRLDWRGMAGSPVISRHTRE